GPPPGAGPRARKARGRPTAREGSVDEAQDAAQGGHRPVVDPVPAATRHAPPVHLRDQEGAVRIDRLDIGDVPLGRRTADAHYHDGARSRCGALREAEGPRVPPPLRGVPPPGDVALMGDPPGAVAIAEAVATPRRG